METCRKNDVYNCGNVDLIKVVYVDCGSDGVLCLNYFLTDGKYNMCAIGDTMISCDADLEACKWFVLFGCSLPDVCEMKYTADFIELIYVNYIDSDLFLDYDYAKKVLNQRSESIEYRTVDLFVSPSDNKKIINMVGFAEDIS